MKRIVWVLFICVMLLPGCSLFGSNDGGGSSGSGGEKETTMVDQIEMNNRV